MMRRFWTAAELESFEAYYADHTASECAAKFGRTVKSIYMVARLYGLTKQSRVVPGRKLDAAIRRLNRAGWSDSDVAAELSCDRHTIARHRKRLGLPSRSRGARYRERLKANTRRQCAAAGVANLGEYRSLVFAVRAVRAGYPAWMRMRHLDILAALEHGPMTRREICGAIGLAWHGSRKSLKTKHNSYLAELMESGFVVDLGRIVGGRGKHCNVHLYSLAIGPAGNGQAQA